MSAAISPESQLHVFSPTLGRAGAGAVELGMALGARLDDCERLVDELATGTSRTPTPISRDLEERRRATRMVATLLIARWLVTGEGAEEAEARWISDQGELAAREGVSIAEMAGAYLRWRDAVLAILRQEAQRLGVSDAVAEGARRACRS